MASANIIAKNIEHLCRLPYTYGPWAFSTQVGAFNKVLSINLTPDNSVNVFVCVNYYTSKISMYLFTNSAKKPALSGNI